MIWTHRVAPAVLANDGCARWWPKCIFNLLGEGERKMLTLLIAAFSESLACVELAGQAGYSNAKRRSIRGSAGADA